ncbi:hypothetical protein FIBSPDRAFT_1035939 [Athelia psychrophila]|uniref:Uncharacterized protein n=1 Tax=Athelia psychrophila TaxID=1759441 RepID=A0A166WTB4_9AGAM|nr:hypothetical protein FIBSPDRAFT_1035939 [Fibularhizoctonia sp. CBS 109695]
MDTVSLLTFAETDIEGTAAAMAFASAEGKVQICYNSYSLGDWTTEAAGMIAALEQDKKRVLQMKERFGKSNTTSFADADQITLTIQKPTDTAPSATLNSVMWHAISEEGAATINEWHLEQGTPRQRVDFHRQASDFEAGGPLFLVRTPGGAPAIHGRPGGAPGNSKAGGTGDALGGLTGSPRGPPT